MRAIRGAICAERNTREAIYAATQTLLRAIVERNGLALEGIVSVFFTMTPDLDAEYPAYAARDMGWTGVPMLGAVETPVPGALTRVIRVLLLARNEGASRHVYLGRAVRMRPDHAEPGDERRWNGSAAHDPPARAEGTLLVVGLGLIGASLAAAARRSRAYARVWGCDVDPQAAQRAAALGYVDEIVDAERAYADADLVVLAAPSRALPDLVRAAGERVRRGAVITDVGSVKGPVVRAMDELPEEVRAVGGHPMAGRERSGPDAADPRLFEGAAWALVATRRSDEAALDAVRRLVAAVGARTVHVQAAEHDRAVAVTSHLPALAACALALAADRAADETPAVRALVGPGFRSATRLAAAAPPLTADLLAGSRAALAAATRVFLDAVEEILAAEPGELEPLVSRAREMRARLAPSSEE